MYFTGPFQVAVREEPLPSLGPTEVMVRTTLSAISAGTEMLFYRNHLDEGIQLDASLSSLSGVYKYPFKYGYASVGEVVECGKDLSDCWLGRSVFSFHPHESHYVASLRELMPVPAEISPENAVFLPSVETALSLVMDGQPLVGENVVVLGQGVTGLLTTGVLALHPLGRLVTLDRIPLRRHFSEEMGAHAALEAPMSTSEFLEISGMRDHKADLTYEISGAPEALDFALTITGFEGRVVLGSWYGNKPASLHFGRDFHRNRMRIISSQVTNVGPSLSGRWDKKRRYDMAWKMIQRLRPERLITHRMSFEEAPSAYRLIDSQSDEVGQVVFSYGGGGA